MTTDGEPEPETVVLNATPTLREWVRLGDGGALLFSGQDLDVREIFGADEYEWVHTVAADQVPALLHALGEPAGTPVLRAVARHAEFLSDVALSGWFQDNRIDVTFWHRMG